MRASDDSFTSRLSKPFAVSWLTTYPAVVSCHPTHLTGEQLSYQATRPHAGGADRPIIMVMLDDELSRDEIWRGLRVDLGDELLAQLLRVPSSSLAGYALDTAPHAIEERVAHLATVRQHLSGTYNAWGMRRWFERPRAQLDGRSPLQVLVGEGDWTPEGQAAESVASLARALLGMPAT